jgi:hypothetical protein
VARSASIADSSSLPFSSFPVSLSGSLDFIGPRIRVSDPGEYRKPLRRAYKRLQGYS